MRGSRTLLTSGATSAQISQMLSLASVVIPPVSQALERNFANWAISFERDAENPSFDWAGFHSQGIALSRRLFREIGHDFRVFYVKPHEDPNHEKNGRIEIRGDQIAME